MSLLRTPYSYSRVEKEDPEEQRHRKAQFLIYKVMEKADTRRRQSSSRLIRLSKLKIKIGRRLMKLRKSMQLICRTRASVCIQVMKQLKHLKSFLHGEEIAITRPVVFG